MFLKTTTLQFSATKRNCTFEIQERQAELSLLSAIRERAALAQQQISICHRTVFVHRPTGRVETFHCSSFCMGHEFEFVHRFLLERSEEQLILKPRFVVIQCGHQQFFLGRQANECQGWDTLLSFLLLLLHALEGTEI